MLPDPEISLVMPMHNEAENIGPLLREILSVFDAGVKKTYEVIIVDDASTDGSAAIVEQVKSRCASEQKPASLSGIILLRQSVQSGQFKSLIRGISAARGRLIITMDSDLQQDPADIPRLLPIMDRCDMVCGIRTVRHDRLSRRIVSKLGNRARNLITGDSITDSGCMLRIMRSACAAAIIPCEGRLFGCEALFFPLLVRKKGFRILEAPVTHRERGSGNSKYHLLRGRLLSGIAASFKVRFGGVG